MPCAWVFLRFSVLHDHLCNLLVLDGFAHDTGEGTEVAELLYLFGGIDEYAFSCSKLIVGYFRKGEFILIAGVV